MPIATRKPLAESEVKPNLPKIQPDSYKGVVYDDNHVPLQSLIAFVSGAPMSVDYYSQVVGEHNDLREVDPGQSGTFQQYQKTVDLEIRVEEAFNSSYDTEKGITSVRGSALLYPFMVPNVADYFITDAADNQRAIFRITEVERKTHNRDSVYHVEYEMVGYASAIPDIFNGLESKVIRSYHFSKDRLMEGLSPTLRSEEQQKVLNLKAVYRELAAYYFKSFFDPKHWTLVLPGQTVIAYDSFLVKYLTKITDTTDASQIRQLKVISTDRDPYLQQPQFWDLMFSKDYNGLKSCNQEMGLVSKELFNKNSYIQGLAYSNIKYIMYPVLPDISTLTGNVSGVKPLTGFDLTDTSTQKGTTYTSVDNTYVTASGSLSLIKETLHDNLYVLSADFYNDTANMSVLETLTKAYLKGQAIDLDMLYALVDKYRQWKRLDQFYYGPILMTLVKQADMGQYS